MTFTLVLRRIHMYLALFFTPWVLVYGLSTLVMNHMPFFSGLYGKEWGAFRLERQMTYDKPLPLRTEDQAGATAAPRTDPDAAGRQILQDLGLEGASWTNAARDGSRLTIGRMHGFRPRRITYTAEDRKLTIERQVFQWPLFLRQLHTRRGYGQPYLADDLWALGIDLFIVTVLLWGVTGLWMWYRMRRVRPWGVLCAVAGCGLFAFFVWTI